MFGGRGLAKHAKEKGWEIIGIMNNDMIGNIKGVDGIIDNMRGIVVEFIKKLVPFTKVQDLLCG